MPGLQSKPYGNTESTFYVRVEGRDDVGKVIQAGKNLGGGVNNVYAYVIHFESTGEVCFYDSGRVTRCDENGNPEE